MIVLKFKIVTLQSNFVTSFTYIYCLLRIYASSGKTLSFLM